MEPVTFHLGYRRWLDGLRGVAVLLVLASHLKLLPGGFLGVDLFFVLSGFLITSLLVEEWQRVGSISLKRFYARRALRLLPAFGTLLVGLYVLTLVLRPTQVAAFRAEAAVAACYVANWPALHQTPMPMLGHTWSLSVEEQFYLLWPLLLYGMLRLRFTPRAITLALGAGILASSVHRCVLFSFHPPRGPELWPFTARLYMGLDTRADALLIGCLLGMLAACNLLPKSPKIWRNLGPAAIVAACALGCFVARSSLDHFQLYYGYFTLLALLFAVILLRLLSAPCRLASSVLESSTLVGIGRISYGLYLYHIPIIEWLEPSRLGWTAPVCTLQVAALSFAVAIVSYLAIERPCLRLKSRLRTHSTPRPAHPHQLAGARRELKAAA